MAFARVYPAVADVLWEVRRDLAAYAASTGAGAVAAAAVLAAHEAAANAVVHAYGGGDPGREVRVRAELLDGRLSVVVADDGGGFRTRRRSPGAGFGLAIIATLADELRVRPGADGGTEVAMGFALPGGGGGAG